MAGFEYGNARLRAMRSYLLPRRDLHALCEAASLDELIGMLSRTPYRHSVELALMRASALESIYAALREEFAECAGKIRHFYEGSERGLVNLALRGYDLHNLKTVLRGLAGSVPGPQIASAFLPASELPEPVLNQLLRAPSARAAIDLLATMGHPFARPLLAARQAHPGADAAEMELVLDCWQYDEANRALRGSEDGAALLKSLKIEADISNIMTVLRLAAGGAAAQMGREGLERLLVRPGVVPVEQLERAAASASTRAAVETLASTPYAQALRAGAEASGRSGRLSEIEAALRHYQHRWLAGQIAKDPLGLGVVLGYLALKSGEIANIRRIAVGVYQRRPPDEIRAGLEVEE